MISGISLIDAARVIWFTTAWHAESWPQLRSFLRCWIGVFCFNVFFNHLFASQFAYSAKFRGAKLFNTRTFLQTQSQREEFEIFLFVCGCYTCCRYFSEHLLEEATQQVQEKKKEKSMLACSSQKSAITRIEGWRMSFSQLPSLCAGQELSNNLRNRRKRPRQVKSRSAVVQKITRLSIYVWASPTSLNNKQGAGILATQLAGTIKISQLL